MEVIAMKPTYAFGLALGLLACCAPAADSGGYRGPNRDGVHPETGLLKRWPAAGLKLLWRCPADPNSIWDWSAGIGSGMATPGIFNKTVYISGVQFGGSEAEGGRRLICRAFGLDGKLKWKADCGPGNPHGRFDGPRATPEMRGKYLYVTTGLGRVNCLDPADGRLLWWASTRDMYGNKVPTYGYNMSPVLVGDVIAAPIRRGEGTMAAFDVVTGRPAWLSEPSGYAIGDSSPVLIRAAGRPLIAASLWWAMVVADPATGKILWRQEQPCGFTMTRVPSGDKLFATFGGVLYAYRVLPPPKVLQQIWTGPRCNPICQAVAMDGRLYVIDSMKAEVDDRRGGKVQRNVPALVALDQETGKRLAEVRVPWTPRSLIAADGHIYAISTDDTAPQDGSGLYREQALITLYRPTRDTIEEAGQFKPIRGTKEVYVAPVIAEGRLFHRHGNLLAVYDLRPESYR